MDTEDEWITIHKLKMQVAFLKGFCRISEEKFNEQMEKMKLTIQ